MSNDDFRRDLNNAFDDVTGTPSSGLRDRVRSAVAQAPERRQPYWIAGVAAAVIAALIVAVLFVANPLKNAPSLVGAGPSPSPSTQPFVCTEQDFVPKAQTPSAGGEPTASVTGLRAGQQGSYDRLIVDSGPVDIVTGYAGLAEVTRLEDFEGVVQLGLGVNGPACYRAFFLSNPARLVVDVQTSAAPSSPTATATASAFACTSQNSALNSAGTPPPVVYISGLRPAAHGSSDRLVIDLSNGVPANVTIEVRSGTTFTLSPSGMSTTLKGSNGILVTLHGADLHTSYSGPIDIVTGYPGLAEVKRIEDFEGVVQLGLGVNGPACYHAFYLTNPNRLVIDVQTVA
ncbi:MAG: hypothetical protein E6I36_10635 [Chloroflexi bacterium]|nr:MAG: hypothetical protein E6I36_10635 [Chloroflexota bacterium]